MAKAPEYFYPCSCFQQRGNVGFSTIQSRDRDEVTLGICSALNEAIEKDVMVLDAVVSMVGFEQYGRGWKQC